MEIIRKYSQEILFVYGIYSVSGDLYYLVAPDGYRGLLSLRAADVEILNNKIPEGFVFNLKNDGFTLFFGCLEDEVFLGRLLECDPDAVRQFEDIRDEPSLQQ